jgi:hypothetical protein
MRQSISREMDRAVMNWWTCVAPCSYCVNRRFRGTYRLHFQGRRKIKSGSEEPAWVSADIVPRSRIIFFLLLWKWRRYVPPKYQLTQYLHGATSQKTVCFIVTVVKTSNLTISLLGYFLSHYKVFLQCTSINKYWISWERKVFAKILWVAYILEESFSLMKINKPA